jgi:hypothetical protein
MVTDLLSRALERLYAAPLAEFIALRKELVAELRGAGERTAASQVAAAAKPTRTAWALNQVARRQPEVLRALFQAREAAADPSLSDADARRNATRDYRQRMADTVRAGRDALAESGATLDATQARRMAETLQAACAGDGEARWRLLSGTLTHDVDVEDPFAGLVAEPSRAGGVEETVETKEKHAAQRERDEREKKERERKDQQHIREARARISELEEVTRDLREKFQRAEAAAALTARDAHVAKRAAEEGEERLAQARADLESRGRLQR